MDKVYWKKLILRVKNSIDKVTSCNIGGINKMRAALVVGHSKDSQGACNCTYDICEWEFNDKLVNKIYDIVDDRCETEIVYRNNYKSLPDKINSLNPNFIICFHANAFNTKVAGCETLYYHKSAISKKIARIFQNTLVKNLDLCDRGIKAKTTEERGGYILKYTNAPCILLEPFFIDNDDECKKMNKDWRKLAIACRDSIYEVIKKVI